MMQGYRIGVSAGVDPDAPPTTEHPAGTPEWDDTITERWAPEAVSVPHWRLPSVYRLLAEIARTVLVLFPTILILWGATLWWVPRGNPGLLAGPFIVLVTCWAAVCATRIMRKYRSPIHIHNARFELTETSVRLHLEGLCREVSLSDIEKVAVVLVPAEERIGHVVLYKKGRLDESPAIPIDSQGSGALPRWFGWFFRWSYYRLVFANQSGSDPWEGGGMGSTTMSVFDQLYDGAPTLWLVANPEQVRNRIVHAMRGTNQNARGPYR